MKKYLILIISLLIIILAFTFLPARTLTGLDTLEKQDFDVFKGKAVGVVTNHTAVNKDGIHLVDLLVASENIKVKAIFAPEHGFRGKVQAGGHVDNEIDQASGATVYSIYGRIRKPTEKMLEGVDVLIFDIQDIGSRFYTFISTMGHIIEAGAENDIPVYILDRPNPIGRPAEGPIIEKDLMSFVGAFPIPIRHGMTVGELATMIKGESWVNMADKLDLTVIEAKNWNPKKPYEKTKITWVAPSPNMRNVNEALLYPGMCLFESTNFSEGRGTDSPFELVGAPYINSADMIEKLSSLEMEGIQMEAQDFTPVSMPGYSLYPKYENILCHGLKLTVTDPETFDAVAFGAAMLSILAQDYPDDFVISRKRWMDKLWGNSQLFDMLKAQDSLSTITNSYKDELKRFVSTRESYLKY